MRAELSDTSRDLGAMRVRALAVGALSVGAVAVDHVVRFIVNANDGVVWNGCKTSRSRLHYFARSHVLAARLCFPFGLLLPQSCICPSSSCHKNESLPCGKHASRY